MTTGEVAQAIERTRKALVQERLRRSPVFATLGGHASLRVQVDVRED